MYTNIIIVLPDVLFSILLNVWLTRLASYYKVDKYYDLEEGMNLHCSSP